MKTLALSPAALGDLEGIADYIAKYDPDRAVTYVAELEACAQVAAERPFSLPARDDVAVGLRSIRHRSHLIFFRVLEHEVRVVRIVHVARNMGDLSFD